MKKMDSLATIKNWRACVHEVLRYAKKNAHWDNSLKCDLAFSLWSYRQQNSTIAAVNFVTELKRQYNSKLLSYVWLVFPINILESVQNGHHTNFELSIELQKELTTILKEYPNDPWADFGYYALGLYDEALKFDRTTLKDILLYASGYKIVKELKRVHQTVDVNFDPSKAITNAKFSLQDYESLKKALKFFERYVNDFPKRPHGFESAQWITWIYLSKNELEKAVDWARISKKLLRNSESFWEQDLELQILIKTSLNNPQKILSYLKTADSETSGYLLYTYLEEIEKVLRTNFDVQLSKLMLGNFDVFAVSVNDTSFLHSDQIHELKTKIQIIESARIGGKSKGYAKASIILRKKLNDRRLAILLLNEGLAKFHDPYLAYLKIICYREYYPSVSDRLVIDFLREFPRSELVDDVLAEFIYIQSYVFNDFENANKTLTYLIKNFYLDNACDNAYNWYAYALLDRCKSSYDLDEEKIRLYIEKCEAAYKEIEVEFPFTRFAKYAKSNLKYIDTELKLSLKAVSLSI